MRADSELAAQRAAKARAERFVRIRNLGDGTALLTARAEAADTLRFSRLLDQLAGGLSLAGSTDEHDVLRAEALGVLADPEAAVALLAGPDGEPSGTRAGGGAGQRSWWSTSRPGKAWVGARSWARCWPNRCASG